MNLNSDLVGRKDVPEGTFMIGPGWGESQALACSSHGRPRMPVSDDKKMEKGLQIFIYKDFTPPENSKNFKNKK